MINQDSGREKVQKKEKIRKRMRTAVDQDKYEYYPRSPIVR